MTPHPASVPHRVRRGLRRCGLWILLLCPSILFAADQTDSPPAIHQLRVYEIYEHNKAAFHERFRDHAMRIMQRYGFTVEATWEAQTEGRTEFVYLLRWPDEATMKDSWKRFLADEEWRAIKRETGARHGALVGDIQEKVLRPTGY